MTDNQTIQPIKRRRLARTGRAIKKQVPASDKYWDGMQRLIDDTHKETGVKLTVAHILREGATRYMRQLRFRLNAVKAGSFHARQRKPE